jgi:hypothetical protein
LAKTLFGGIEQHDGVAAGHRHDAAHALGG